MNYKEEAMTMLQKKFTANDYGMDFEVYPKFSLYIEPENIALALYNCENHELYTIATVNLEYFHGREDHLIALDINNCPNCDKYLKKAGYIEEFPDALVPSGYVNYPVYPLTPEAIALCEEQIAKIPRQRTDNNK